MKRFITAALSGGLVFAMASAQALEPNDRVANFRLYDHTGGSHHLHYFSDMDAVVLMAQDASCDAADEQLGAFEALKVKHADRVQFFMVNSTGASREEISNYLSAQGIEVPVLLDEAQLVGRDLNLNRAGEALVIDPDGWQLVYRGDAGTGLTTAVNALVAGDVVAADRTQAAGCDISYVHQEGQQISYADTVVPILADNCVSCHRDGGIGPWAMNSYAMVQGFAPMIREVLMTKRMPPWHADPEVGHWANDRAISRNDLQTLVSWIDAGAPRGTGEDPLQQFATPLAAWGNLGEPDLVIDIPATDIPATGVVDYQYKHVTNPLDRDVWVRASQIKPGDRTVLHHVITRFGEVESEGPRKGRLKRRGGGGLAGYVPGRVARELPDGTGTLLPAGATIEFQMHYTTSGVATTDHSQIGVYFHEEEPEHRINALILANGQIKIPARAKAHSEEAVRTFEKDALVYSILPHSHFRGKAARFVAIYPDGSEELLLNVPNYDFNWQTTYLLEQPKFMPAGTKIVYTNWWDNSAQNPANPNPDREVRWGQQSWDEMIFGAISYRDVKPGEGDQLAGSE